MKKMIMLVIFLTIIPFFVSCNTKSDNGSKSAYVGNSQGYSGGFDFIMKISSQTEISILNDEYKQLIHLRRYNDEYFSDRSLFIVNFVKNGSENVRTVDTKIKDEKLELRINYCGQKYVEDYEYGVIIIEVSKVLVVKEITVRPYDTDMKEYGSSYYPIVRFPNGYSIYV